MNLKTPKKSRLVVAVTLCLLVVMVTSNGPNEKSLTIGVIFPYKTNMSEVSEFERRLTNIIDDFRSSDQEFKFPKVIQNITFVSRLWENSPSPNAVLQSLCDVFLPKQVTALLYVTSSEVDITSTRYFLQLANYLGIPVIAWNAISSGLEKELPNSVILQLAPRVAHQASAMMEILIRYKWNQFAVVTTGVVGHDDFVHAIQEAVNSEQEQFRYEILAIVKISSIDPQHIKTELNALQATNARIILLHASVAETKIIFQVAKEMRLTNKSFAWIVTQSVVGTVDPYQKRPELPVGLLGISFDASRDGIMKYYENITKILGHGLELFTSDPLNHHISLQSNLTCYDRYQTTWREGLHFFKYLRNVSFTASPSVFTHKPETVEFQSDGTLKYATLEVVNMDEQHKWRKVGFWQDGDLHIHDIIWPGRAAVPPFGRPERYHLTVTFLEEPPYLNLESKDNSTGQCPHGGVPCVIPAAKFGQTPSEVVRNETYKQCCSGFCIDLLKQLSKDLNFTFLLKRVEDSLWGSQENGSWNGIIGELLDKKADMAVSSVKINAKREKVIDFSVPFLESGIAVVVAKRTGIISPVAFLEPFDPISWFFILVICLHAAGVSIFFFEWLSPDGFDKKFQQPRGHNFSLFRSFWLVWARFLAASVNFTSPRGYTARFMSNVWSGFTVVILAIYTANLAAVMITREEYYQLTGVDDKRLIHPFSQKPPLKFGTVRYGNTDSILRDNFPLMHSYMNDFNKSTPQEGVKAVKKRELDAFVYDSTVLDYLVGKDDECRLLTVGSWYAMTGYGIALPPKSKYLKVLNEQLLLYRSYGYLEKWHKFWFSGACKPTKQDSSQLQGLSYVPVSMIQFASAFILLGCGILLAFVVLGMETFFFKYLRKPLADTRENGFCHLISMNLGRSLKFQEAVYEARDVYKTHKCKDPICDMILWKARRELDLAKIRLNLLQNQLKHQYQNAY